VLTKSAASGSATSIIAGMNFEFTEVTIGAR